MRSSQIESVSSSSEKSKKKSTMFRCQGSNSDSKSNWPKVVFVLLFLTWVYYAYMFILCGTLADTLMQSAQLAIIFNVLFAFVLWCYVYTALAAPAPIPVEFSVEDDERQQLELLSGRPEEERDYLEQLGIRRGILTANKNGSVRYCEHCERIKPDRSHHCKKCERCIVKMDHHCPWFNNCVSFTNYKAFLLTITYATLLAIFTLLTTVPGALKAWFSFGLCSATLQVNVLVACSAFLCISLGFLVPIHVDFVFRNVTTLENMGGTVFREFGDSFNIGRQRNFVQVFGPKVYLWLFPVFSSLGDGCRFPTVLHPDPYNLRLHLFRRGRDDSSSNASLMRAVRRMTSKSKAKIEASAN